MAVTDVSIQECREIDILFLAPNPNSQEIEMSPSPFEMTRNYMYLDIFGGWLFSPLPTGATGTL
jgi:hypothetical protein